jgi:hypothetical protein
MAARVLFFIERQKVERYCERKTENAEEDLENFVHLNLYF